MRRKYAKKGWSEAKIKRALESSEAARSRRQRTPGFTDDVVAAFARLAERIHRFAVLVHWYSGRVEFEQVTTEEPPQEVDVTDLANAIFREDRLLWING